MRNLDEWYDELKELCEDTQYQAMFNNAVEKHKGVAIVPINCDTPQRVCVYPKNKVNAGFVVEMDVYEIIKDIDIFTTPARIKRNRPHYNQIPDEDIIKACKIFLGK